MSRKAFEIFLVVLAVVGALAGWYFLQREQRALSVVMDANISMVSLLDNKIDGVELRYRNKKIDSLSAMQLTVVNTGNAPIKCDDFSMPLHLKFDGDLASKPTVVRWFPAEIDPVLQVVDAHTIRLNPLLMNSGDSFAFQVYVANLKHSQKPVSVDCRIVGVKYIDVREGDKTRNRPDWSNTLRVAPVAR